MSSYNIPKSFKVTEHMEMKMHEKCEEERCSMSFLIRAGINSIIYSNKRITGISGKPRHQEDEW